MHFAKSQKGFGLRHSRPLWLGAECAYATWYGVLVTGDRCVERQGDSPGTEEMAQRACTLSVADGGSCIVDCAS